jgi:hypothetical protein
MATICSPLKFQKEAVALTFLNQHFCSQNQHVFSTVPFKQDTFVRQKHMALLSTDQKLLKQKVLHDKHKLSTHACVPQLLKITTAWASVWSDVHQQLQLLARTVEENFLSPH